MGLPKSSHLQLVILDLLAAREMKGKELRGALQLEHGIKKFGPTFYRLMSRIEDNGFIVGKNVQKIVDGQIIRERVYSISGEGHRELSSSLAFYRGFRNIAMA